MTDASSFFRGYAREIALNPNVSGHDNVQDAIAAGGGGGAGNVIVRHFPFTFATAGLATGAAVYVPTVGDILLEVWLEIDTAWNGTTPKCDVGPFVGIHTGWWFNFDGSAVDMTAADSVLVGTQVLNQNSTVDTSLYEAILNGTVQGTGSHRLLPGKFSTADPVKVAVTQDGTNNGAATGATQGAATLYLVTATPA